MSLGAILIKSGLLVEADLTQCTRCLQARIVHEGASPHSKISFLFVKSGCAKFEVRPFSLLLSGEVTDPIQLVSFEHSQDLRSFIRDLEHLGLEHALAKHPEAQLGPHGEQG